MAAVAPLRSTTAPRPGGRRTPLRLIPPMRRRRRRAYGDALFATTLSALLAVGIVGVLLLNTSMQTQADRIAAMRQHIATLSLQLQQTQTALDRDDTPSALAARAAALHMRPAGDVPTLRLKGRAGLSARGRAARTNLAG